MAAFQPVPDMFRADGSQFIQYLKNWIRLRQQNRQQIYYYELEDGEYNHRPEPLIENENIFDKQTHDTIYDIYENTEDYLKSLSKTLIDTNNPQTIVVDDYQFLQPDIRQSLMRIKSMICFHLYCSFLINTPVFYDMFEYDGLELIFSKLYNNFGIINDFSILQFLFKYHFDNIHNYGFGTVQHNNFFFRTELQLNYVELIYYYIIKSNIVVPAQINITQYLRCSRQNGIDDANNINRGSLIQPPYSNNPINTDNTKDELDKLRGLDREQLVNEQDLLDRERLVNEQDQLDRELLVDEQDQEYLRKEYLRKLLKKKLGPDLGGIRKTKKENPHNKLQSKLQLRRVNSIDQKMGLPRKVKGARSLKFGGAIKKLRKTRKSKPKRNKTKNRKKKSKSKRKTKR